MGSPFWVFPRSDCGGQIVYADKADYNYRVLSGNEKLQLLLDLKMAERPDGAVIERSARVHPLTDIDRVGYVIVGAST